MRQRLVIALLATAPVFFACGGDGDQVGTAVSNSTPHTTTASTQEPTEERTEKPEPSENPEDALLRQLGFMRDGQWGRHWDELHPQQQAIVGRGAYVDCAQGNILPIEDVEIIEVYDEPIDLESIDETASKAITVEVRGAGDSFRQTFHEVNVDGQWRWVLGDDDVDDFARGACPL